MSAGKTVRVLIDTDTELYPYISIVRAGEAGFIGGGHAVPLALVDAWDDARSEVTSLRDQILAAAGYWYDAGTHEWTQT